MAVIVISNIIHIKKPYAHLHYPSNMFTKYKKNPSNTIELVDYTRLCKKGSQTNPSKSVGIVIKPHRLRKAAK